MSVLRDIKHCVKFTAVLCGCILLQAIVVDLLGGWPQRAGEAIALFAILGMLPGSVLGACFMFRPWTWFGEDE